MTTVSEGWNTAPLGSVATLQRGFDLPGRLRLTGSVPIISSSGLSGWHNKAMVSAPGVVTGRYGTIGQVFYIKRDYWPLNTTLWVANFHGNDPKFVYYLLQRVDFATHSGKSGVPGVNRNDLHSEQVSVPRSLAEQRQIAEHLTQTDELIVVLERLIAKKQAIKQGMMQQLLTGKTRLPGFSQTWSDATLGEVADVTMGQSPPSSSYNSDGSGLPLVQGNADIRNRRTIHRLWTTQPTKRCSANDVLLTVRAPVGFTAIASGASCLGRGVCSLNNPESSRFLYHALVYAESRWVIFEQGSTFTAVNSAQVRAFMLPWPEDADERQAISTMLDEVDGGLELLHSRLAKAKAVKQGMMQQLLTSRVRLPLPEAAV